MTINTIAEALKKLYAKLGGTDNVADVPTVAEMIDKVTEVAGTGSGGGGGGYDIVVEINTAGISPDLSAYTVNWDYPAVREKVLAGELVTGIAYCHFNYDEQVDGDTSISPIPMFMLNIFSDGGSMTFKKATVDGSTNTTSAAFFVRNFELSFDLSTGAITQVSNIINKQVSLS